MLRWVISNLLIDRDGELQGLDNQSAQSLLNAWRAGDLTARDKLFERLHIELRKISLTLLRGEGDISLMSGDLINEAVLRIIKSGKVEINDKAHFLALAAQVMRRVLIDHARKRASDKRHHHKVTLLTHLAGGPESLDILQLEQALIRLKAINDKHANIVELRYYGGMTFDEIAEVMSCSTSTVKRSWRVSRTWLLETIEEQKRI